MSKPLYDLKHGDHFRIAGDNRVPPAHRALQADEVFRFAHIDGAYSLCYGVNGQPVHPAAGAQVEVLP